MSKTAIITGSSRGIGKEIALELAKQGYNVVINSSKSQAEGDSTAKECALLGARSIYIKADVSTPNGAKKLIEETIKAFGKVDVLVNNAGVTQKKLFIDCNEDDICGVLNHNINCVLFPSKEFINLMKNEGGAIVNISSIQSVCMGSAESLYSASKAAINGLTRALAAEYGAAGIRVNAVCPGFIETNMTKCYNAAEKAEFCENVPLKRLGTTTDVAKAVLFLASDDAAYISGQCLFVDGGTTIA